MNSIRRRTIGPVARAPGASDEHGGTYIEKALAILILLVLLIGCFLVLRPFIAAILWATILSYATRPAYTRLLRHVNGRRGFAAALLTLGIAVLLLGPIVALGMNLAGSVVRLIDGLRTALATGLPPPPVWIADLPFIGPKIASFWQTIGHDAAARAAALEPYVAPLRDWLLARGGDVLEGILQVSLSLLTAFFFYRDGPVIIATLEAIGSRLAGARAGVLLRTAGATINGVVRGVLGTALIQALLMAAALWATGVPGALVLGFISFFLAIIPMALTFVWLPASIWLASQDAVVSAGFIAVWGLVVGQIDNILRPYLIRQGSELPVLLILLGILGGAMAFGFIGIFLGPTLLAIAHSLIRDWGTADLETAASVPPGSRRADALSRAPIAPPHSEVVP